MTVTNSITAIGFLVGSDSMSVEPLYYSNLLTFRILLIVSCYGNLDIGFNRIFLIVESSLAMQT